MQRGSSTVILEFTKKCTHPEPQACLHPPSNGLSIYWFHIIAESGEVAS